MFLCDSYFVASDLVRFATLWPNEKLHSVICGWIFMNFWECSDMWQERFWYDLLQWFCLLRTVPVNVDNIYTLWRTLHFFSLLLVMFHIFISTVSDAPLSQPCLAAVCQTVLHTTCIMFSFSSKLFQICQTLAVTAHNYISRCRWLM